MRLALIVGCADCVWDEVEAAQKLATFDEFYICKLAGVHWDQGFFHWVTLHPEYMAHYQKLRREQGLPDTYEIIAPLESEVGNHWQHPADRRVSYRWPKMSGASGSSGLYGVKCAMDDGCTHVVLAGIPMTREARHFTRGNPWVQVDCFTEVWKLMLPKLKGRVKSFSGWTNELLGPPTREWLEEARDAVLPTGETP